MNINFPPVDEKFIKSKIEEGYYSNATELVRDAVRRLREKDAADLSQLFEALEKGENSIARGKTKPYTRELLAQIEANALQATSKDMKPLANVRA